MTERSARILLHPISSQQWNAIDADDDDVSNDDDADDVGNDDAESSRQINWL